MARTKPVRCLAAVALATALLSTPSLTAADPAHSAPEAAARQEGLWARLLAWLPETPISFLWTYSADIDPNGRPASTSSGSATSDSSSDIDPNG
ncbi:MAG TPA: hypothetical protein VKM72_07085 [Thermoanaerobaculia bacterium]|nr:hypothetical protein [Thermoanaerobaculia bacterium]